MPSDSELRFRVDGAERHAEVVSCEDVVTLRREADAILAGRSGVRVFGHPGFAALLGKSSGLGRLAAGLLGDAARPVRAVLFDKTAASNWSVAWHQDRTIAVRERRDVAGFGPWSTKSGAAHVEPPFDILAGMVTIRLHLDDCGIDNAALMIAPGSHRLGRVPAAKAAAAAERLGMVTCEASAGDAWVYATPIIHTSQRARVPGRRRVLQVDYASTALPEGLDWLGIAA
jgi:Phytanoyl-CoA dioxygenase (PhyH)